MLSAAIVVSVVVALQIPWMVHASRQPSNALPGLMGASVTGVTASPLERLHPIVSGRSLLASLDWIFFEGGLGIEALALGFSVGAIVLAWRCRDGMLKWCAFAPLVFPLAAFAIWQGQRIEWYWYEVAAPSATLCLLAWLATLPRRALWTGGFSALVLIAALQPMRVHRAWNEFEMPYGALLRGTRELIASDSAVSKITIAAPLKWRTDSLFLFSLLGGRNDNAGPVAAINERGEVSLVPQ